MTAKRRKKLREIRLHDVTCNSRRGGGWGREFLLYNIIQTYIYIFGGSGSEREDVAVRLFCFTLYFVLGSLFID